MTTTSNNRLISLDILRGLTIAGMIIVNNPGGGDENTFAPLLHADWIGLTPTDMVFPLFMFIMGITTYISLQKTNFSWSGKTFSKIIKRAIALWLIGLAITWTIMFTRGMISPDNSGLDLWDKIYVSANSFGHLRILGVLPRLGICYGLAAILTITVRHKYLPWLILAIFGGYYLVLEYFNGYSHDATNIIAIIDNAILGPNHVYRESPDPEGLLSTLPALAHVLIGVCIGKLVMTNKTLTDKIENLFLIGSSMLIIGVLFAYACPISKKLWTPTFALTTCGIGCVLFAMLIWSVDKKIHKCKTYDFLKIFGLNPLALFIISDILLIPFSILHLIDGTTIQHFTYANIFCPIMPSKVASLLWAIIYLLINWTFGLYLYKKKIIIKL